MQFETNFWLDEDKVHDFIVDLLVDFGILYGEELIADARNLRGTEEIVYLAHGVKNFYIVAQNTIQQVIRNFKDGFLNIAYSGYYEADPLFREKRIKNDVLALVKDFERLCERSLVILSRGKNIKEIQELMIKEKKRVESVLAIFKEKGLMPKEIGLSAERKTFHIGHLVNAEMGIVDSHKITSTFAAQYLSGVYFNDTFIQFLSDSYLLSSEDFMVRWGAYVVSDHIFKKIKSYEEILKVSKEVGEQYSYIKEQTLKATTNILSINEYEIEMFDFYRPSYLKNINRIEDFLYYFNERTKDPVNQRELDAQAIRSDEGLVKIYPRYLDYTEEVEKEIVRQDIDLDASWRQEEERFLEENCPCFWYIKREAEKSLIEIHKDTLDKTSYALNKIRSVVPKEMLYTLHRSSVIDKLRDLEPRDLAEISDCLFFLNHRRIQIFELMSKISQKEIENYVEEIIRTSLIDKVWVLYIGNTFRNHLQFSQKITNASKVESISDVSYYASGGDVLNSDFLDMNYKVFFTSEKFLNKIKLSKKSDEQIYAYKINLCLKSLRLQCIFNNAFNRCGFSYDIEPDQNSISNIFITGIEGFIANKEIKTKVEIMLRKRRESVGALAITDLLKLLEEFKPSFKDLNLFSFSIRVSA